ncbi:hypothetical protein TNCV_4915681 [Trichonephila clavipes]|nr:hypothetical protein TNCV_4915681 [Trichonephila clavipes]
MFKHPTAAAWLDLRSSAHHRRVPCARDCCSYACLFLSILSKSTVKKQKGKKYRSLLPIPLLTRHAVEYNRFCILSSPNAASPVQLFAESAMRLNANDNSEQVMQMVFILIGFFFAVNLDYNIIDYSVERG